jgi:2-keto-3-deoxy-L-rhamnonate aldolase RhmA
VAAVCLHHPFQPRKSGRVHPGILSHPRIYLAKADAWPLNPDGELLLGLKLEDKYALANAEQILKIPGIAFAEWGPGDMALSLDVRARHEPPALGEQTAEIK